MNIDERTYPLSDPEDGLDEIFLTNVIRSSVPPINQADPELPDCCPVCMNMAGIFTVAINGVCSFGHDIPEEVT